MFMKTMAVGPLAPAELCVTGGATVALPLLHRDAQGARGRQAGEPGVARLSACMLNVRMAVVMCWGGAGATVMLKRQSMCPE